MGNQKGVRLDYKQEIMDGTLDKAKNECEFSDRLYDLLFQYQERLDPKNNNKAWRARLAESEKVGDLNLPLSRLYNQIWSVVMGFSEGKPKKKQKQMEVIAQWET